MQQNISLQTLTTLGIGGPADYFLPATTIEDLQRAFSFAKERSIPFFVLGKGSNSLFSDRGFRGLIIHNKIDFLEHDGAGIFIAGAGCSFSLLGLRTARDGWSGLEFASGIPATVGGAVYMNAGAQGGETQDCLMWVDYLHFDGRLQRFTKEELVFSYRSSPFQKMRGAIVAASFQVVKDDAAKARQMEMLEYRMRTQPYRDKSAGCIFKNPTPIGAQKKSTECFSAGFLIEQAGCKGLCVGGAEVSELHANFLINKAHASAEEFFELIHRVQARVLERTGVQLVCELRAVDEYGNE